MKRLVLNDAYKPHSYSEVELLISAEVASRLDKQGGYGVWWWNRHSVKQRAVTEPDQTRDKRYSKRTFVTLRSEGERVDVPVPAYLNRPLVDLARDTLGATGASSANTPAGSGS